MKVHESTTQNWIVSFIKIVEEVKRWKVVSKIVIFCLKEMENLFASSAGETILKTFVRFPVEEAVNRLKEDFRTRTCVRN